MKPKGLVIGLDGGYFSDYMAVRCRGANNERETNHVRGSSESLNEQCRQVQRRHGQLS